jgi:L-ribulokinase
VDDRLVPLARRPEFAGDLDACAWLWKDHCAYGEAGEITRRAAFDHAEYLRRCGGTYSSEWYFSKLLHCLRVAPRVMDAADGWIEQGDFVTGFLTGSRSPRSLKWNVCAAGHKALYHHETGFPAIEFLAAVDARLGEWCRGRLGAEVCAAGESAGELSPEWAKRLGIPAGVPVSVAAIDAHVGAVGAGVRPGVLVKILGTSGCDMAVHPAGEPLDDIPGLCGIVKDSILPGHYGLEAGQPALGDLFGWFVRRFTLAGGLSHGELTARAARLRPGESGLLALDWNNGNRTVLADPLLSGCLVGQTLQTDPADVYRALLEATAFGARVIMRRFEDYGVSVDRVVACGGIAEKNHLLLQLYADITGRPLRISRSQETCALGAAIFGAVAAGPERGGFESVLEAQDTMTGLKGIRFEPNPAVRPTYDRLFRLYVTLHDAFGGVSSESGGEGGDLRGVMKELIAIREAVRKA